MTPQQSGVLIAIFGIVNTVGRVLCGWLADRTWCDEIILNSVFLIVGGILTFFVPAYSTFTLMASYCAVYGLVAGNEDKTTFILSQAVNSMHIKCE